MGVVEMHIGTAARLLTDSSCCQSKTDLCGAAAEAPALAARRAPTKCGGAAPHGRRIPGSRKRSPTAPAAGGRQVFDLKLAAGLARQHSCGSQCHTFGVHVYVHRNGCAESLTHVRWVVSLLCDAITFKVDGGFRLRHGFRRSEPAPWSPGSREPRPPPSSPRPCPSLCRLSARHP